MYSTKVKKQLRARGGGAESTPQKDSGSPQSSPPSSERVQSGLGKFFGTGSQKRGAEKPVSKNWYLRKGKGSADFSRMP